MLEFSYKSTSQSCRNVAEHTVGVSGINNVGGDMDYHNEGKHRAVYEQ